MDRAAVMPIHHQHFPPMATILCILFWIIVPLILIGAIVNRLVLETQPERIRRMRQAGMSQRAIADALSITRYRVHLALA
jgi:hypothetical protein